MWNRSFSKLELIKEFLRSTTTEDLTTIAIEHELAEEIIAKEIIKKISELKCGSPARICSRSSRHCWRSQLPHASELIQREFGCVLGVQQTKQLPHVAKGDLMWQLGCNLDQSLNNHEPRALAV
ncbi:hypothetical protein TNCV_3052241 [Trichonephila clavipes]|nr:hypothetical protein TNCV_3052241 [Trichonephila clavipes]